VAIFEGIFFIFGPLVGISAAGASEGLLFVGGLAIVIFFTAIGCLGVRMAGYLLQVMFWIPAALTVYIIYLLGSAMTNPAALTAGLTTFASSQGFSGVTPSTYVTAALSQGLDAANVGNYWSAVNTAMIGAYFAYVGYAASTFVAGEVKEANKTLPKVLLLSSVVIIIMYVTVSSLAAYASAAVGRVTLPNGDVWSFFESYAYMSYGGGSLAKAGTIPVVKAWSTTIAGITGIGLGLSSLNWLVLIFAIFWVANDIPPFILTGSRILFAMAFDRVLPNSIANVNERFHSPVNATIITGVFAAVFGVVAETLSDYGSGTIAAALGGASSPLYSFFANGVGNTDLFDGVFFTFFALSLVLLPLRKSRAQIYDSAPVKYGGKTGMVTIGVIGVVANLFLDYMIASAEYSTAYTLVVFGVIGAIIYAYYKYGKKDVDYSTIFAQIPPE